MIYEFKVTLKEMPIPVWRKIQIDSEATFYDLHKVLQAAFNWYDSHLHSFFVNKTNGQKVEFIEINQESEFEDFDSSSLFRQEIRTYKEVEENLSNWFKLANDKVSYVYDFGDNWEHEIVLSKILQPKSSVQYPRCISAKNAAPQENGRGELLMGEIDLEADEKELLLAIEKEIEYELTDLLSGNENASNDTWPELLQAAKDFHKAKPWDYMSDEHIFAVQDPATKELLFCSVMGAAGEMFGLAVYIGKTGYQALIDTVENIESQEHILFNQRSIVVSFEDREALSKEDYSLIKSYDIPFRGRNAWPAFISYSPGYYPWMIDDEEARLMLVALRGALEIVEELVVGLELPDVFLTEKVYTKVPKDNKMTFDNQIFNLKNYLDPVEFKEVTLDVSEIELKRAKKLQYISASVEFVIAPIDMPIQNNPNERPIFPLMVLVVEHEQGLVIYQNILHGKLTLAIFQSELLKVFQAIGGIPEQLMMDEDSAINIFPIAEILDLNVKTDNYLSIAYRVLDDMQNILF